MAQKEIQLIQLDNVMGEPEALYMAGPETPDNYQAIFDSIMEEAYEEAENDILDYAEEKLQELDIHRVYAYQVTTDKL